MTVIAELLGENFMANAFKVVSEICYFLYQKARCIILNCGQVLIFFQNCLILAIRTSKSKLG